MVRPIAIRFEHLDSPVLGIGVTAPRISWSFEGQDKDWQQASYELRVQRDSVHETYKIQSAHCQFVPWPSRELRSQERALVWVRVKDASDVVSEWSEEASVEIGLLQLDEWRCSRMESAGSYNQGAPHPPVVLGRKWHVPKPVSLARLYITAHGVYNATINGKQVGDHVLAPGWTSYNHRLIYQTFDVTKHLCLGENSILVDLAEGWYCGRLGFNGGWSDNYGTRIGLIAMLSVQFADGEVTVCGSDEHWRWTTGPIQSAEIYNGELYDARGRLSDMVWDSVTTFPLPGTMVAPISAPIRRALEVKPKEILKSRSGKIVLDMGQNMVGWLKISVSGPAGTRIDFQHAEVLENGEVGTRPLRHAACRDSLILAENPITWQPKFTFHGFRYVEITNWPGELRLEDIVGIVIHTDMRQTGHFSCSNQLLNRLNQNVMWSVRGNFLSIPTDCPQRDERLGWTGDINVFGDTANLLFDTAGILSSWLTDLVLEQTEASGIVPLVVPNILKRFDVTTVDAHAIWGMLP